VHDFFCLRRRCKKRGGGKKQANVLADKELLKNAQGYFQPIDSVAKSEANPLSPAKIDLGHVLYYDTRLSKNGGNSCNSCHNLSTFGVDNLPTSKGDAGNFGERNSPTVLNAAFHAFQFWDGRSKDVEEQAGMPILNPVEMAIPSKDFLVKRLKGIKEYQEMFKAAFPDDKDPITYDNIQKAIGAFERTLVTRSTFDTYLEGDISALTPEQREGLKNFIEVGCTTCHNGPNLGGTTFQKFGVFGDYRTLTNSKTNDEGRKSVTKSDTDKDMFKTPGLRNIAKTHPYFHDGSVQDLKDAVKIMGKLQLNKDLTDEQIKSIVTFLEALTGDIPEKAKKAPAVLAQN
jgi:cytochrome c peroxidase